MFAWAPEWGWTLTWSGAREQGQRPGPGEVLHDVHELAAAVVALPGRPSAYLLVSQEPCASSTAA